MWQGAVMVVSRTIILLLIWERAGVRADPPLLLGPISSVRWQQRPAILRTRLLSQPSALIL